MFNRIGMQQLFAWGGGNRLTGYNNVAYGAQNSVWSLPTLNDRYGFQSSMIVGGPNAGLGGGYQNQAAMIPMLLSMISQLVMMLQSRVMGHMGGYSGGMGHNNYSLGLGGGYGVGPGIGGRQGLGYGVHPGIGGRQGWGYGVHPGIGGRQGWGYDFGRGIAPPGGLGGESIEPFKPSATFSKKAPQIMERLMQDFNLTPEQAAGIVGNFGAETGGFKHHQEINPAAGSRGGIGWAQWTGSRRDAFERWAARNGLDPRSDEANYGFLKHELQTTERNALDAVRQARTTQEAMYAFERTFERSGVKNYSARSNYANQALRAYESGSM